MVLYAASSALDTDFVVRLSDVFPNGKAIFMTEGILRARYRNGTEGDTVELLEPTRSPSTGSAATRSRTVFKRATGPPRRHELELPALLAQPQYRRGRRYRHPDGGRTQTLLHTDRYPSRDLLPVLPVAGAGG